MDDRRYKNVPLHQAKQHKRDEFYTQLSDIENELRHYRRHFVGKMVYCNCDDPRVSNFFQYFSFNFERLGLRKLITTCYKNQNADLFSQHDSERAIWLEYTGDKDGNRVPDAHEIGIHALTGDGDFRSSECVELLRQADIVVTNPPFSLFREYVAQLVRFNKQFLIIGSKNAITYKEIFPLIRANRLWLGCQSMGRDMLFDVPEHYAHHLVKTGKLGSTYKVVAGKVKGRSTSCWFTNLDHKKRRESMILYKRYSPEDYPKYDNYDAINVNKTAEIPCDYEGIMGVPISFLDKYNPGQFEIVGVDYDVKTGLLKWLINPNWAGKIDRGYINGKRCYARILIRHKSFS
ncbi:MAG: adenine-specific methyltransferase EcoRI family protein [Bacteroidota bacterium]|nr:adenine-specific methyltransferase EcoRI family protein [Bacteroidota bacterium]